MVELFKAGKIQEARKVIAVMIDATQRKEKSLREGTVSYKNTGKWETNEKVKKIVFQRKEMKWGGTLL